MEQIEIERVLQKRYRNRLYSPFIKALKTYDMLCENDVIGVCVSGGKDSLLLAKLFQLLARHSDFPFQVKYLAMDPGFTKENRALLEANCEALGIPIQIKSSNVFMVAQQMDPEKPCYMCARMRRGFLYQFAKDEGCNKIALAHHFDDVIETTMLNLLYAGCYKTMMPKLRSQNHPGMELIRPLVFVEEKDILLYTEYIGITPMRCGCPVASNELPSKRREIKQLIRDLKTISKTIPTNIFKSSENVNTNCCIQWKDRERTIHFLDRYETSTEEDE